MPRVLKRAGFLWIPYHHSIIDASCDHVWSMHKHVCGRSTSSAKNNIFCTPRPAPVYNITQFYVNQACGSC